MKTCNEMIKACKEQLIMSRGTAEESLQFVKEILEVNANAIWNSDFGDFFISNILFNLRLVILIQILPICVHCASKWASLVGREATN